MEIVLTQLPALLTAIWWPFCRTMAMFSAAPILGDAVVPVTVRLLLSLVLAVILMPTAQPAGSIEPLSLQAFVVTIEEVIIGFGLGFAFHLTIAAVMVLGYLISSQMGLSMAAMNDPLNGTPSDQISSLIYLLVVLVFFSVDGHLVLTGVVGASFHAYPVGGGVNLESLQALVYQVAWVFSAALLLAVPVVFSALVVQVGFGLLNRIAPALNLYSLGFSAVTLFGLVMLTYLVRFVPQHYLRMTNQVLEFLQVQFR
jgi:flagellar biosynthetic protein FliR